MQLIRPEEDSMHLSRREFTAVAPVSVAGFALSRIGPLAQAEASQLAHTVRGVGRD